MPLEWKHNFLFACAHLIENKIEQEVQRLKWCLAKVAFDTL